MDIKKNNFKDYNHFKSKDDLALAVMDRYWEFGQLGFAVLRDTSLAPLERIDRYLAAFGFQENGCLLGNFSAELVQKEIFRSKLRTFFQLWIEAISRCIESGQKDGTIRSDFAAVDLAKMIVSNLEGAILTSRVEKDIAPMELMRKTTRAMMAESQK